MDFTSLVPWLALVMAGLATLLSAAAWIRAQQSHRLPYEAAARLERMQADLAGQFDELLASHKKLRSRIGMRELRERRQSDDDDDDDEQPQLFPRDVAGYKAKLRQRLGLVPGRPAPIKRGSE